MNIFMKEFWAKFKNYRIIMAMDQASWHKSDKMKKWKNIVPLHIPAYSPELNPVENIWHHIREKEGFKNTTFKTLKEVEERLVVALNNLDNKTVKSITLFSWIKSAI